MLTMSKIFQNNQSPHLVVPLFQNKWFDCLWLKGRKGVWRKKGWSCCTQPVCRLCQCFLYRGKMMPMTKSLWCWFPWTLNASSWCRQGCLCLLYSKTRDKLLGVVDVEQKVVFYALLCKKWLFPPHMNPHCSSVILPIMAAFFTNFTEIFPFSGLQFCTACVSTNPKYL